MATNILATGNTAASSTDVTINAGDAVTFALKGFEDGAHVTVEIKDDLGIYNPLMELVPRQTYSSAIVITAPGVYRFTRSAGKNCGVFRSA